LIASKKKLFLENSFFFGLLARLKRLFAGSKAEQKSPKSEKCSAGRKKSV
jgi:hypothetical protein